MTLILSDKDVREVADMAAVVADLEDGLTAEAVAASAVIPERMSLSADSTLFRVMPAILPAAGVLGLKYFHGSLAEGIRYSVIVSEIASGEVVAVVDAAYLTAVRTGATSGVATRRLAREDARRVGLIGSGLEAETNLAAVCAVRPIDSVRVYSRSSDRRGEFADRMAARLGVAIEPVADPEAAVGDADIVVVATNTGPNGGVAYRGAWLRPAQHLVSIGSTAAFLREIDEEALLRPDVVVFDADAEQVGRESGDVMAVLADCAEWGPDGTLDDVLTGRVGRSRPDQVTLFKSVGTAAQDLISAYALYRVALDRNVGLTVPDLSEPKQF